MKTKVSRKYGVVLLFTFFIVIVSAQAIQAITLSVNDAQTGPEWIHLNWNGGDSPYQVEVGEVEAEVEDREGTVVGETDCDDGGVSGSTYNYTGVGPNEKKCFLIASCDSTDVSGGKCGVSLAYPPQDIEVRPGTSFCYATNTGVECVSPQSLTTAATRNVVEHGQGEECGVTQSGTGVQIATCKDPLVCSFRAEQTSRGTCTDRDTAVDRAVSSCENRDRCENPVVLQPNTPHPVTCQSREHTFVVDIEQRSQLTWSVTGNRVNVEVYRKGDTCGSGPIACDRTMPSEERGTCDLGQVEPGKYFMTVEPLTSSGAATIVRAHVKQVPSSP